MKRKTSNTCIAVIRKSNGKLMMAGDKRISWGMDQAQEGARSKVIKKNGMLFGGTGDSYLCELLCDEGGINFPECNTDPQTYMFNTFYFTVLKALEARKIFNKETGVVLYPDLHVTIAVGIDSELYEVQVDSNSGITMGAVNIPYAMGCGGQLAWGSLLTTEGTGMNAKQRLTKALQVAAKVSPGCDDNITFVWED